MPTPRQLGYRMPAEWEPHEATWLSWPHRGTLSFPGVEERIPPALARLVGALAGSDTVRINVADAAEEAEVRRHLRAVPSDHVEFWHIPTDEPWCRDHGPIFLVRDEDPRVAVADFDYNAWGCKLPAMERDREVARTIARQLGLPVFSTPMILEGGSIDVNGRGTLLTTRSCLLNPNRNPSMDQAAIEHTLRDYLGLSHILWLGDGIEGDDTDGHVDDITRFVAPATVLTAVEEDASDPNFEPLQHNLELLREMTVEDGTPLHVLPLPMPSHTRHHQGHRLPQSYANFYIGNRHVLLPAFNDPHDTWAAAVLKEAFPDRTVVPVDCSDLIVGLGAIHCLTQQQPAAPASSGA